MEEGDVPQLLRKAVEEVEEGRPRPGQVQRHDGRLILTGYGQGAGHPRRVGQHAVRAASRQAAGGEDHEGAFRLHRLAGELQREAGAVAGAFFLDPLDRDQHFVEARDHPVGVGVGVEADVGAQVLQGVEHRNAVGDAGGVVADENDSAMLGHAVQARGRHLHAQHVGHIVQSSAARERADGLRHSARLAVVQHAVERRADHRPGRAARQFGRPFGDQHINDVVVIGAARRQGRSGGCDARHSHARMRRAPSPGQGAPGSRRTCAAAARLTWRRVYPGPLGRHRTSICAISNISSLARRLLASRAVSVTFSTPIQARFRQKSPWPRPPRWKALYKRPWRLSPRGRRPIPSGVRG